MLERTDAITNEVLEPTTFVLAYLTVLPAPTFYVIFCCVYCKVYAPLAENDLSRRSVNGLAKRHFPR